MRRKKGRKGFMMVKIDLEKAYDRVSWHFLRHVLLEVGFNTDMVEIIMASVTSTSLSVLWNGVRLESFRPERGLRQGDPLAPYLFVLCMELLSQKIARAVDNGSWRPVHASRHGPGVSHLLFADDLLLFGEATEDQAHIMEGIITSFCRVSGQKVNTNKSKLFVSPNVSTDLAHSLSQRFDIPLTLDLGMYLGMPLLHGRVTSTTYAHIIDKVKRKLAAWKGRLLSRAGRSILIQSVTSTVPFYAMNTVELPMTVVDQIEKANRAFFWGEYGKEHKLHTIAWETICQPKELGGVGIKRLRVMNHALLAKLAWRLIREEDVLWVKVIKAKYGDPFNDSVRRAASTHIWRGILSAITTLQAGLGGSEHLPRSPSHGDIEATWKEANNEKFSVNSAYRVHFNHQDREETTRWKRIWSLKGPRRGNFLLWQARWNKLPTNQLLFWKHLRDTAVCEHCKLEDESGLHSLRDCSYSQALWHKLVPRQKWYSFFGAPSLPEWIDLNLHKDMGRNGAEERWQYIFREGVHSVWYWRNKCLHDENAEKPPVHVLMDRILAQVKELRIAWESTISSGSIDVDTQTSN